MLRHPMFALPLLAAALLASLSLAPQKAEAATPITIGLSPSNGVAPYQATLTWNAPGAVACTATGAWSGTKAASGSLAVTVQNATPFGLNCSYNDDAVLVSWTAPTTNTDGSQLTDLAGFNIYRGTSATTLARIKSVGANVLSYSDAGLGNGTYFYGVTAVNANSKESDQAKSPSVVTKASSLAANVTPGISPVPSTPGAITVTTTNTSVSVNVQTQTSVAPASP